MNSVLPPELQTLESGMDVKPRKTYRSFLTGVLLALAAWSLHLPAAWYGFVYYDDVRILKDHPELYGQPTLSADGRAIFVTCFPREEPLLLRDVTWAIDSRIFGFGNPFGYHLVNILLHGVVVAVLFGFLLGTTRRYGFAVAVALGYLVLAVHTEPVVWIMGRKDVLSTLFMLLALCAQTRRLDARNRTGRCGWYVVTVALLVCGLLSKISVLTFPFVLFLHGVFLPYLRSERSSGAPLRRDRGVMREGLLLVPTLAASAITYFWYHRMLAQMGIFDRGYTAHGLSHLWNLLVIDPLAFWIYLRQIFFPWQLRVLYTWPTLQAAYAPWQIVASLMTLGVIGGTGVWLFWRRKDLFFYYAAFFVLMVPYLNLLYIGIWVADRYVYCAVLFLVAMIVSIGDTALQRPKRLLRIGAVALGTFVASVNLFQKLSYQHEWRNAESLWQYHITLPSPSVTAYENLAAYYYAVALDHLNTPQMESAMRKMAVTVDAGLAQFWTDHQTPPPPQIWYLFFLKSIVQEVDGNPQGALASLLTSDSMRPRFDSTNLNLGRLYHRLAANTTDGSQKENYARQARDRFATYMALAFRGRVPPTEVRQEMESLEVDYEAITKTPVPAKPL